MSAGYQVRIPTRWMDTDAYGHVNNAQYYSLFDTAVTTWLIEEAGMDAAKDEAIGLCVESMCRFAAPIGFPETVTATVRAGRIGGSSVRYELVLHGEDGEDPVASGHFTHVYVDRRTRKPTPIPARVRERLEELVPTAERVVL